MRAPQHSYQEGQAGTEGKSSSSCCHCKSSNRNEAQRVESKNTGAKISDVDPTTVFPLQTGIKGITYFR